MARKQAPLGNSTVTEHMKVNERKADPLVRFQQKWWVAIGLLVGFGLPTLIG